MIRAQLLLFLAALHVQPGFAELTFDWAYVGNAGNAADPETGKGSVLYNFAIAKTEVTLAQYAAFLNAVDPKGFNSFELYTAISDSTLPSVRRVITSQGIKYAAPLYYEQYPATILTWYSALRFANWTHNGGGSGDTETGAYTLLGGRPTPTNAYEITRNPEARFWLPSENEWYKAAYHDSTSGVTGAYFDYATGSNAPPVSDRPENTPSAVNMRYDDGLVNGYNDGFAMTGSPDFYPPQIYATPVGAFASALSPYGTLDQNGNAAEWTESLGTESRRAVRGGSFYDGLSQLAAISQDYRDPSQRNGGIGFRLATIPEPSAIALAAMLTACGMMRRRPNR